MRLYMLFVMPILTLASAGLFATPFDDLNGLAHCAAIKDLNFSADMAERDFNSAYRKLALFFHPDKNREKPDWAKEKAIEVNNARDEALKLLGTTPSRPVSPSRSRPASPRRSRPTTPPAASKTKLDSFLHQLNPAIKTEKVYDEFAKSLKLSSHTYEINNFPPIFLLSLSYIAPLLENLIIYGYEKLQKIAAIGSLKHLKELSLFLNEIDEIPVDIGELKELTILSFQGNNIINIPAEIGNLPKLEKLHLDNNKIQNLPPEIGNLPALKQIGLSNNPPELANNPANQAILNKLKARGVRVDI